MRTHTNTDQLSLWINREAPGVGDLGLIVKGVELTRLNHPNAWIGIRCPYPKLIRHHPAFDAVFDLDGRCYTQVNPNGAEWREITASESERINSSKTVQILIKVSKDFHIPKHQAFCAQIGDALQGNGFEPIEWDGKPQTLWIPRADKLKAIAQIQRESTGRIPIGIFGRSALAWKDWYGFQELLQLLVNDGRFAVFYFDAKEPVEVEGVINIIGLPLDELAAQVSCMKLVIGNDSGGIHIAGGVGVPVLGIFGATDPEMLIGCYDAQWFENTCPHHPCWFKKKCFTKPCLREIPPERVYEEITKKFRQKEFSELELPSHVHSVKEIRWLIARFIGLGDVLMTWFLLDYIRIHFPEVHLTYLTSPEAATLFYGQENLVDDVIPLEFRHHANPGRVELPIDLTGYNQVFNLINMVDSGKIVYRRPRVANFAAFLDLELPTKLFVRKLKISEQERQWFYDLVGHRSGMVFVFQLDSNGLPRRWFPGHFQELAWMIYKAYGDQATIICVGSKAEPKMKLPPNAFNLSGRTGIRQYVASLVLADFIVCTDSSGLHIGARAEKAKVIGLFGSTGITETGEWAHTNYYDNVVHIKSDKGCSPCWDWQLKTCNRRIHYPVCLWKIKPDKVFEVIQSEVRL